MIKSIIDLDRIKEGEKVVLLYSGGLDSSYLFALLRERNIDVRPIRIDIGGQEEPISNPEVQSILFSVDAKEEFIDDYVLPHLKNYALYESKHPLSASLSRPLFAKKAFEYAQKISSNHIIHSATCTQNSLRRFNNSLKDLGFSGSWGSPFENTHVSRKEKIKYLSKSGISCPEQREYSFDTNLWCREFESGNLNSPESLNINENFFYWTSRDTNQRNKKEEVSISFEYGIPTSLNGKTLSLYSIIEQLNELAGISKIGRIYSLEEAPTGKKVIEIRECPAAITLINAYKELGNATFSHATVELKNLLGQRWITEAAEGRWFGHAKKAIDEFNHNLALNLTGEVTFQLLENSLQLKRIVSLSPSYEIDRELSESTISKKLRAA